MILIILLPSCERNKNDVIPDTYVEFTLDIYDFPDLSSLGGSAIIDKNEIKISDRRYAGGNDDNGIIVYRSLPEEFSAYDRTCPHDYVVNGLSVKVNIDFTLAVCPQCSTKYALSAGGTPYSGPGRYPLKNYKTRFDGRFVSVWNY